ncbi:MAG: VanZ family protein [Planctomycetes bacterium]|nr:VanZ family protein [Planctomycetota bacterium]
MSRHGRWLWLAGAMLAIAYGSLIPFDFDPSAFTFSDVSRVGPLHGSCGGLGDLITNVLLYLPLGWLAVRFFAGGHAGILRACLWSLVLGSGLSLSLEVLQTQSYSRVASWSDVLLNTSGTALGAVLGVAFTSAWVPLRKLAASRPVRNPYAALASFLAVSIWLFNLAPFDFLVTTESLQRSFLNANWNVAPGHHADMAAPTLAVFVGKMTTAVWFGVLAYLWAFACLWSSTAGLTKAIAHTMALVWLVECMQLFTVSHVFELSDIFLRSLSAILGAWTAVFIVDHTGNLWKRRPSLVLPTMLLVALVVVQARTKGGTWDAGNECLRQEKPLLVVEHGEKSPETEGNEHARDSDCQAAPSVEPFSDHDARCQGQHPLSPEAQHEKAQEQCKEGIYLPH